MEMSSKSPAPKTRRATSGVESHRIVGRLTASPKLDQRIIEFAKLRPLPPVMKQPL